MKFLHFGVFFAVWMCLDGKEIGQISRLIPVEDWIDFKNRTRDVKPLEKFIGKLRATYDFVFHKPDNVSNVEKILNQTEEGAKGNGTKLLNSNISFIARRKIESVTSENETRNADDAKKEINRLDDELNEDVEKFETGKRNEFVLEHLEILDDSLESFDEETEKTKSEGDTPHSKFALPYAIAQAFLRWIVSLYFATSNHFASTNEGTSR